MVSAWRLRVNVEETRVNVAPMRALLCDQPPRFVTDHPEPVRGPGEALIRVRTAGVCDTDIQLVRGYMGYRGVLGHEFVGEVLDADSAEWIGRRVVADINVGCGECDDCRLRDGHHCRTRSVLGILGRDGAMAERLVISERCLVPVPDAVTDERAVFAEPLAAALHVLDDVPVSDDWVAVVGDGKLGLLIALCLQAAGRTTVLIGHHREKLALASARGVDVMLEEDLPQRPGGLAAVVEATGSARGLSTALSLVKPRGTLILKTTVAGGSGVDLSPIVINELRVIGSRCGNLADAMAMLHSGLLDPSPLIAARYPLSQADRALAHAATKGVLKVLVEPS